MQHITIVMSNNAPIEVRAVVRGEWALHESLNFGEGVYAYTHLPSSLCADGIMARPAALARALKTLGALPPSPIVPSVMRGHSETHRGRGARLLGPAYVAWAKQVGAAIQGIRAL